jgi:hypothetical protein
MTEKKELSQLAKTILSGAGHITTFTQSEFDEALALAKAEIMMVAIETTKKAIFIERDECAKILEAEMAEQDTAVSGVLEMLAERIRNRIPAQRQ